MLLVIKEPGPGETAKVMCDQPCQNFRALKTVFIRHRLIELFSIIFH